MPERPKRETVDALLQSLALEIPSCYMMAVTDIDGLPMGQWQLVPDETSKPLEEERIAAMSSAMLALGERILTELEGGDYRYVISQGERGTIFLIFLPENCTLSLAVRDTTTIDTMIDLLQTAWHRLLYLLDTEEPTL